MGAGIIRIALSVHISKRGEDMAFVLGLICLFGGFYLGMVFMAILAMASKTEEDETA